MADLIRYEPSGRIKTLRSVVDSMFDEFMRWPGEFFAQTRPSVVSYQIPVDIIENESGYIVKADVPGMNKDNLEIEISKDALVIRGKYEESREEEKAGYRVKERQSGAFSRVIPLGPGIDTEKASAKCQNGVLEVSLPKSCPDKPKTKKLEIQEN